MKMRQTVEREMLCPRATWHQTATHRCHVLVQNPSIYSLGHGVSHVVCPKYFLKLEIPIFDL